MCEVDAIVTSLLLMIDQYCTKTFLAGQYLAVLDLAHKNSLDSIRAQWILPELSRTWPMHACEVSSVCV